MPMVPDTRAQMEAREARRLSEPAVDLRGITVKRLTDRCADLDDKCTRLEDALHQIVDWVKGGCDPDGDRSYIITEAEMALRDWRAIKGGQ